MDIRTSISTGEVAVQQRAEILKHLRAFNAAAAGPGRSTPLCIAILDDGDGITGGLFGTTAYDWLVIELLFVPESARGSGTGSMLIAQAEKIARDRGCIGAWVDTFSFQARGFYEKLGYVVAGIIPDHPPGGAHYFLSKRLDDAGVPDEAVGGVASTPDLG